MKSFVQIASPHEDIVEGRLTMDVFAADLWQVVNKKAPPDYNDPDLFFKKTFITKGLRKIIEIAKKRIEGKTGNSVIQLQTPFGGGKTHTLIALYHKAKEWKSNVVVFDGTAFDPRITKPWEEIEKQLTGKVGLTEGNVSPGKEKLIKIISENSPVLILMDEILEYITKASGINVGSSTLSAQTFAFMQELTNAVSVVGNSMLVITLPSSTLEHYDDNAERMFQQIQKIVGRVEKIYTPVEDEEIEQVVRARLFKSINEREVKKIVDEFINYARSEELLLPDEITIYRNKFLRSYPFKPEVIDVLYKRWGSFPTFQRTRGILRLLSLVVHNMIDEKIPYIRLGDFKLEDNEIRRELVKHIGQEWDSIIAKDICSDDAGAKKVDIELGTSYRPYNLGTVVSTTIFMMSFSGIGEKGCTIKEIKLSSVYPEFSSTVIDTVIGKLREKLFYISDENLVFNNQPNLNRIIISREESITDEDVKEEERNLLDAHVSKSDKIRVYIHPKFSKDIPDTSELKLVILNTSEPEKGFLEKCGNTPRIYRNVLIFLCVSEEQRENFYMYLRKRKALYLIQNDRNLSLTENQKKEVKTKLESFKQREYEELRKFYRKIFLPSKDGFREFDMGIPTFGEAVIEKEVYEFLKAQNEVLEKISPIVIREKYLKEKDYLEIKKLYEAFLKTPGEIRLISIEGFKESIKEGVKNELFGFGYLDGEELKCQSLGEVPDVILMENEVIVASSLCRRDVVEIEGSGEEEEEREDGSKKKGDGEKQPTPVNISEYSKVKLKLKVPSGKISIIARIANYLREKFDRCEVEVEIDAINGKIDIHDYENKVKEALFQGQIEIKEEDIG